MSDDSLPVSSEVRDGALSPAQVRTLAVRQAAPSASQREVAETADIGLSTLERWLSLPFFRDCWNDAELRVREIRSSMRTDLELRSLRTLIDVQDRADIPASVQVDAASKGLTHVQRAREHDTPSASSKLGAMMQVWAEEGKQRREALEIAEGQVEGEIE